MTTKKEITERTLTCQEITERTLTCHWLGKADCENTGSLND